MNVHDVEAEGAVPMPERPKGARWATVPIPHDATAATLLEVDHVLASVEKTDGAELGRRGRRNPGLRGGNAGPPAPTASIAAFLAVMVVLGLAVAGVVAAFAWLCDCWDKPLPPARPAEHVNIRSEQSLWTFPFGFPPCSSWGWRRFGLMFACIPACDKV